MLMRRGIVVMRWGKNMVVRREKKTCSSETGKKLKGLRSPISYRAKGRVLKL